MDMRQLAAEQARFWIGDNALILDTETTGLDGGAEIIEISVIDCKGTPLLDTLVKPQGTISPEAGAVHGITDSDLRFAPSWPDVYRQLTQLVKDRTVVIYNANFDQRLITQTTNRYQLWHLRMNAHCAMNAYAKFFGEWDQRRQNYRWIGLERAAHMEGITLTGDAHRALTDCRTTLQLIETMAAYHPAAA